MAQTNTKYVVELSAEERAELKDLVGKGKAAARKLTRARILLLTDEGQLGPSFKDDEVVRSLQCGVCTVRSVRQRWVEEGLESALNRKKQVRPSNARKLDGVAEARLIALACGAPPEGRTSWTMKLLAEELVALEVVESISHDSVWRTLKKTRSSLT